MKLKSFFIGLCYHTAHVTIKNTLQLNLIIKYPYKGFLFKKIAYNKYFSYSFYVFSFYKAREISRHFPLFRNNSYFNIFK